MDEENGTKGKILQQGNPSVCNIFPKEKKIKRLLLGLFGIILEITLPSDGQGTNQHIGQGNSIIYFVLSSLSLLNSSLHFLLYLSHCFSANSVDSPQAEEKLPAITDLKFCQWVTEDGAVKIFLLIPPNSTMH